MDSPPAPPPQPSSHPASPVSGDWDFNTIFLPILIVLLLLFLGTFFLGPTVANPAVTTAEPVEQSSAGLAR